MRTTKWENLVLLSESGLNLLFPEVFSCMRTLKGISWAYNKVELQHRVMDVCYFLLMDPGYLPGCVMWL